MNNDSQQSIILSNLKINALNKMQFEAQRAITNRNNTVLLSPQDQGRH